MTKQEWLQICKLSMEWYYIQTVFDGKPLSEKDKEWIDERMPSIDIFDDGRIEYFQQNFKQEINEEELDNLAEEYEASLPESYTWNEPDYSESDEGLRGVCSVCEIEKAFKAGYKSAK